jgi:hypothetical protein
MTSPWRPPPDLLLIGTKRGGTTSAFRLLEDHPGFAPLVPSARRLPLRENMKGVHYFDSHSHRSAAWYRSHFASRPARAVRARRAGAAVTGESSPYYLFHPQAPARASALVPDVRLVVLLRDPVERTISHWAEQTRNGVETLPLVDALDAETERVGDDHQRLARGEIATSWAHENQTYASQSEYTASLRRWLENYPAERLLVLYSEDLYRDPHGLLDRIHSFVGLPPHALSDVRVRNAAPRDDVDPQIGRRLVDRFAPDVEALTALLGERPPWARFGGSAT